MNKLAIITAIYKRYNLTKFILEYYKGIVDSLSNELEIQLFVAGSEGELTKNLVEQYGFEYIEISNTPLTHKFNSTVKRAKLWNPDGLVIIGSDDLLSKSIFKTYDKLINDNVDVFGFIDIYFLEQKKIYYWEGYTNNRKGETIGAGRFLHKNTLDKLGWDIWGGFIANNGMDGLLTKRLQSINLTSIGRKMVKDEEFMVDVKSGFNICNVKEYKVIEENIDLLNNFIDDESIDDLLNLSSF